MNMVNTLNFAYETETKFCQLIDKYSLQDYEQLFVQVFTGVMSYDAIVNIQTMIRKYLPLATVLGCTNYSGILNGEISHNEIVISISMFDHTEVKSLLLEVDSSGDSQSMGERLANEVSMHAPKAMIMLQTSNEVNINDMLAVIHENHPTLVIAGGLAAHNGVEQLPYVFNETHINANGIGVVFLKNNDLIVHSSIDYAWQKIGRDLFVSKANGSIIYEIEQKKPLEWLSHYLGKDFVSEMPHSSVDFPFITTDRGQEKVVFITDILPDGSIVVSNRINEGTSLTLARMDIDKIVQTSLQKMKQLSRKPVETIFMYHCLTRNQHLADFTKSKISMLKDISPVVGGFSTGDIACGHGIAPQILGNTATCLAISEGNQLPHRNELKFDYEQTNELKSRKAFSHLIYKIHEEMKQLNEELSISEQHYRSLFDNNADFIYSTDLQGNFTSVNRAFEETFGYQKSELIGQPATVIINPKDINKVKRYFSGVLPRHGKEQPIHLKIPTKSGEFRVCEIKNIPITINGEQVGYYGIGRNMTDLVEIEKQVAKLAYYDYHTGLPNRVKFTENLTARIEKSQQKGREFAVLLIDIDRFKNINDSFGHHVGDIVLKELANRISNVLPDDTLFGRFEGDKFSLLLNFAEIDTIIAYANDILKYINQPIIYGNLDFFVTASIGVSFYPEDGTNEQILLKNADIAMNRSKSKGGNDTTFYCQDMNQQAMDRLKLESSLRKAIVQDEFFLVYQPLVDLSDGKIFGSEVLIRWQHPKLGLVAPLDFIPIAEETGLIVEIGSWVLKEACRQNKQWHELGFASLSISVNVSARQFQEPDFIHVVKEALSEANLAPQYLTLELTESIMLRNMDYSISVMRELQQLGVKVSIDDFGTGYSSLSYLRNLPIDTLKIDRTFINNLQLDTSDIAIVKAIITMGLGLAVEVIAEGVETEEQLKLLKELNCTYAQGFFFEKPLRAESFQSIISKIKGFKLIQ